MATLGKIELYVRLVKFENMVNWEEEMFSVIDFLLILYSGSGFAYHSNRNHITTLIINFNLKLLDIELISALTYKSIFLLFKVELVIESSSVEIDSLNKVL